MCWFTLFHISFGCYFFDATVYFSSHCFILVLVVLWAVSLDNGLFYLMLQILSSLCFILVLVDVTSCFIGQGFVLFHVTMCFFILFHLSFGWGYELFHWTRVCFVGWKCVSLLCFILVLVGVKSCFIGQGFVLFDENVFLYFVYISFGWYRELFHWTKICFVWCYELFHWIMVCFV